MHVDENVIRSISLRLTGYVGTVLMHVDENVIMRTFLEAKWVM
jgi:hypothetical protein